VKWLGSVSVWLIDPRIILTARFARDAENAEVKYFIFFSPERGEKKIQHLFRFDP